jgi:cystinosin
LNFQNQSTEGWSIGQILFDLSGGILSLTQLILDSSLQGDWSGLWNPTKLGLAVVSMSFDLIFITQHFVLYRESSRTSNDKDLDSTAELEQPLLGN